MKAEDIIKGIRDISVAMSKEQINEAWAALKTRNDTLQRMETLKFQPGDKVWFQARGRRQEGVVKKVNQKSVAVVVMDNTFGQNHPINWKVAPTLLQKVAG